MKQRSMTILEATRSEADIGVMKSYGVYLTNDRKKMLQNIENSNKLIYQTRRFLSMN